MVTEITQYPARLCFAANWQNYEILLILNHLQFISLIFTFRCFCLNCACKQCFFGEHLLTDKTTTKTIAIVESEKTAIIATHFISDFVWLATGGMNGCFNKGAVEVLSGREVVLVPDLGAMDKWKSKLPLLQSICKQVLVSNILEDNATDEQKTKGLDIADFLLMAETPQMALQRLVKQHPPLQHLIDSLGLVLVEEP